MYNSCSKNHTKSSNSDTGCVSGSDDGWDQIANVCVSWDDVPKAAVMIDVCSYPSFNPNSDPSDCVVFTSCASLRCPSQGCRQQVCSTTLGRCVTANATACSDGVDCTLDSCEIFCDSTGCALNPGVNAFEVSFYKMFFFFSFILSFYKLI